MNMNKTDVGRNVSNAYHPHGTEKSKTIFPAARKLADYIARRMAPMIEHGRRSNDGPPAKR